MLFFNKQCPSPRAKLLPSQLSSMLNRRVVLWIAMNWMLWFHSTLVHGPVWVNVPKTNLATASWTVMKIAANGPFKAQKLLPIHRKLRHQTDNWGQSYTVFSLFSFSKTTARAATYVILASHWHLNGAPAQAHIPCWVPSFKTPFRRVAINSDCWADVAFHYVSVILLLLSPILVALIKLSLR